MKILGVCPGDLRSPSSGLPCVESASDGEISSVAQSLQIPLTTDVSPPFLLALSLTGHIPGREPKTPEFRLSSPFPVQYSYSVIREPLWASAAGWT